MKNKFEYFLNAVSYCVWQLDIKSYHFIGKLIYLILYPILILLPKHRQAIVKKNMIETAECMEDINDGICLNRAMHNFMIFLSIYPADIIIFIIVLLDYLGIEVSEAPGVIACVILGLVVIYHADRVLFTNKNRIKYYKIFQKKDSRWQKKWICITIVYCAGGFILLAGCIVLSYFLF